MQSIPQLILLTATYQTYRAISTKLSKYCIYAKIKNKENPAKTLHVVCVGEKTATAKTSPTFNDFIYKMTFILYTVQGLDPT